MRISILALYLLVAAPVVTAQDNAAKVIEGTWVYAKDPTGKVKIDPIYEGSTITFEAGGKYAFALRDLPKPLVGTWLLRQATGNTIDVHTEYGQERSNDLTLTLRRDAKGGVVGFEVFEGDGIGIRYYVPRKK